MNAEWTMASDR